MNFDTKTAINLAIGVVGLVGLGLTAYKIYTKEEQTPEVPLTEEKDAVTTRYVDAVAENVSAENFEDHIRTVWADINFELEEKFKEHPIAKDQILCFNDDQCQATIEGFKKCA